MNTLFKNIDHVNVTVPAAREEAAKHFYGEVLQLKQIPKPEGPRKNVGAWFELGQLQIHLSLEESKSAGSGRHVGYAVNDLAAAEQRFREFGVEIIADPRPMKGSSRFYVRDPGGNLLEISCNAN